MALGPIATGVAFAGGLVAAVAYFGSPAAAADTAGTILRTGGVTIGAAVGSVDDFVGGFRSAKEAGTPAPAPQNGPGSGPRTAANTN